MSRALRLSIWLAVALGIAFAGSQLAEMPARSALRGYDNTFNYLWLRSAMVDGDWDFRNDLQVADTLVPEQRASALALPPTDTGRLPNKYGLGWAVLTLPFYLLADTVVAGGRAIGAWTLPRDGFNPVYQCAIQLGHLMLGAVALLMAVGTIGRWLGDRRAAVAGVLAVWATSSLPYYQTVNVSMSHGAAFFAAALLALAIERGHRAATSAGGAGWWWLVGAAFGLAVITRFQLVVLAPVVVWAACRPSSSSGNAGKDVRRSAVWARLGWVGVGAAPLIGLQLWGWRVVYGHWLVFGYGAEGESFHWTRPELLNSLFSPWHGLFYWHPFLLVAVAGALAWVWARHEAAGWMLALTATVYLNAAWWCWWFASSFGHRGYDAVLLPLMAGTAWLFARGSAPVRRTLAAVAFAAAFWNVYLLLLYRTGAISRNAPVTWLEMLAAAARLPDAIHF